MYLNAAMTTAVLLLSVLLFTTAASPLSPPPPPPPPPAPINCSDVLLASSMCLPYISSFPNNITNLPSYECCHDVASAFASGTAICFCHLLRNPIILGFPLNDTKIRSLTSLCPIMIRDHRTKSRRPLSLGSLCSGSAVLPPLLSITGPGHTKPNVSGSEISPPPPMSLRAAPEPTDDFESQANSAADFQSLPGPISPIISSAEKGIKSKCRCILLGVVLLAIYLSSYL